MKYKNKNNKLNKSFDNSLLIKIINLNKINKNYKNKITKKIKNNKKNTIISNTMNNEYINDFNKIMNSDNKNIKEILPKSLDNPFYLNPFSLKLKYLEKNYWNFSKNLKNNKKNYNKKNLKQVKIKKVFKNNYKINYDLNKTVDYNNINIEKFNDDWTKNQFNNYNHKNNEEFNFIRKKYFLLSNQLNKIIYIIIKKAFKKIKNHKQINLKNLQNYKIKKISKFLNEYNIKLNSRSKFGKNLLSKKKEDLIKSKEIPKIKIDVSEVIKKYQISRTIKLKYNSKFKNTNLKYLYWEILNLKKLYSNDNKNYNESRNDMIKILETIKLNYSIYLNYDNKSIFPNFFYKLKKKNSFSSLKYSSYWMILIKELLKTKDWFKTKKNIGYYSLFNFYFNPNYLDNYSKNIQYKKLYKILNEKEDFYFLLNKINLFNSEFSNWNINSIDQFYFFWKLKFSIINN